MYYSLTYKFLDDESFEEQKKKKEQKRLKNIKSNREYAKKNKEKLRAYRKMVNDRNRIERAKGDKKRWQELQDETDIIKQVDTRTYKNTYNNTVAKIYDDSDGWFYIIKYSDGREDYKSEHFSNKVSAIKDLRLAI